jgi:hypothetical protein
MNSIRRHLAQPPISRRGAVVTAAVLTAVAVVHLIDGPVTLKDQFYIGALELALAVACIPLAILLIIDPMRDLWIAVAGLTTLALACYIASRTTGLPGSTDDIGNWKGTLGILNMLTEFVVIVIATRAIVVHRTRR